MIGWMRLILSLSLSGAAVTAVLLVAARLLGKRLGRKWQYYIWLLAVFRLLLPVAAPANLTGALFEKFAAAGEEYFLTAGQRGKGEGSSPQAAGAERAAASGGIAALERYEGYGRPAAPGEPGNLGLSADFIMPGAAGLPAALQPREAAPEIFLLCSSIAVIWAVIAVWLLGRKIWSYGRAARLLRTDGAAPAALLEPFDRACDACRLRRKPELFVSRAIQSPVAVGIVRPAVAVPEDFSQEKAYYAFLHELTHIRRFDAFYKWAAELTVCIHWFNPMVYVLRSELSRACELSCDEAVIQNLNGAQKREYGDMLLAALRQGQTSALAARAAMTLPLGQNAKKMKERLGAIMETKKKSGARAFMAFTLTAALGAAALLCGFAPVRQEKIVTERIENAGSPGVAPGTESYTAQWTQTGAASAGAARKSGAIPDKIDWDSGNIHRRADQKFTQGATFWENGYMIGLAWNVDSSRYKTVRRIGGKTVCFAAKAEQYADDGAVAETVRMAIEEYEKKYEEKNVKKGRLPMEELLLLGVDGPFEGAADELSVRFYEEDNEAYFAAVVKKAGAETWVEMMDRAYADDRISYFAIVVGVEDRILQSKVESVAKKAAGEGKAEFFAVAADRLPDSALGAYAEEAYAENRVEIFAIAVNRLPKEQKRSFAARAAADGRAEIFYTASEGLTKEERADLAQDAYDTNNIEIFYGVCDALTARQADELAERAYEDGRIEFLYAVIDQMSGDQRKALKKRAKQEGRMEYLYALE